MSNIPRQEQSSSVTRDQWLESVVLDPSLISLTPPSGKEETYDQQDGDYNPSRTLILHHYVLPWHMMECRLFLGGMERVLY